MSGNDSYNSIFNKRPSSPALLVVDDEKDVHFLFKSILRHRNIRPFFAGTIEEATTLLENNNDISLIFLDNRLPDGYGHDQIKKFKALFSTVVVMITAYDTSQDRATAKTNGADYFIGKPFSGAAILNIVDAVCHTNSV